MDDIQNYAVLQRLRFIDAMLAHYGHIGREQLMDFFGVGSATATRDLRLYATQAPGNLALNTHSKRYLRTETFTRRYP